MQQYADPADFSAVARALREKIEPCLPDIDVRARAWTHLVSQAGDGLTPDRRRHHLRQIELAGDAGRTAALSEFLREADFKASVETLNALAAHCIEAADARWPTESEERPDDDDGSIALPIDAPHAASVAPTSLRGVARDDASPDPLRLVAEVEERLRQQFSQQLSLALGAERARSEREISQLRAERAASDAELARLRSQLAIGTAEAEDDSVAQPLAQRLFEELSDVRSATAAGDEERRRLADELEQTRETLRAAEGAFTAQAAALDELRQRTASQTAAADNRAKTTRALQDRLARIEARVADRSGDSHDDLREELARVTAEVAALRAQPPQQQRVSDDTTAQIADLVEQQRAISAELKNTAAHASPRTRGELADVSAQQRLLRDQLRSIEPHASPATKRRVDEVVSQHASLQANVNHEFALIQKALSEQRAEMTNAFRKELDAQRRATEALQTELRALSGSLRASASPAPFSPPPLSQDSLVAEELRRQRLETAKTFETHGARLTEEFSDSDRALLATLPVYRWRRDDAQHDKKKRALRRVLAHLRAIENEGADAFLARLRSEMRLLRRTVSPQEAQMLTTLLSSFGDRALPLHSALHVAELGLLGDEAFDANVLEELRLARTLPSADSKTEYDAWRAGSQPIPDTLLPTRSVAPKAPRKESAASQSPSKPAPAKQSAAAGKPGFQ